jgi:hypothetical protein
MTKRAELRGVISIKPSLNRYLRVTSGGLLCYSHSKSSIEDITLEYRQVLEVERGW